MQDRRARKIKENAARTHAPRLTCAEPGCNAIPTERKLYCFDHVDRNDYAQKVAAEIASRERDERTATRRRIKNIDVHGSRAREILERLSVVRVETPEMLAQRVDLKVDVLDAYIEALVRAGLVKRLAFPSDRYKLLWALALGDKAFARVG